MTEFPCMAWLDYVEIDHDVERDGLVSRPAATRHICDQPAGHEGDLRGRGYVGESMSAPQYDAEARVAAILLEIEGISHHFLNRYADTPDVQAGADAVCSRLDVLLAREERIGGRRTC